jgi:hypothetical protein
VKRSTNEIVDTVVLYEYVKVLKKARSKPFTGVIFMMQMISTHPVSRGGVKRYTG